MSSNSLKHYNSATDCNYCDLMNGSFKPTPAQVVVHWYYRANDKWILDQRFCIKCARSQYSKWKPDYWIEINRIGQETRITMK